MNDKIPTITSCLVAYAKAGRREDFDCIFDSLSLLSFKDFFRFVKRSGCYQYKAIYSVKVDGNKRTVKITHPEYFWNSQLTIRWAKELFCSDSAEELLFGFFSKTENYN